MALSGPDGLYQAHGGPYKGPWSPLEPPGAQWPPWNFLLELPPGDESKAGPVQEYLWLAPEVKNREYKAPLF